MPVSATDIRLAKIKTFVAELTAELPATQEADSFATPPTIRQKKLSTVVARCGSRLATAALLKDIEAELARASVYSHRPISSPALKRDDFVKFSRVPFTPDELFFDNEQLLKEFLRAGVGSFGPLKDLELESAEFGLPSRRRIDLLCRERRRDGKGALVAVELKKANQATGVVNQVVRYLKELSAHPLAAGRSVRGMIISGKADDVEARQLKTETEFLVEWFVYEVRLDRRAASAPKPTTK
jgi:hypothetical protein